MSKVRYLIIALLCVACVGVSLNAVAQDTLPDDNGIYGYHESPAYRESESHPLRIIAYVLHPIGWVLREGIFRPLSYFASSTPTTRSVMGYRNPYDYRKPECFSGDETTPNCHKLVPYNYEGSGGADAAENEGAADETAAVNTEMQAQSQVYFPNVYFDYNSRELNDLGRGLAHQLADMIKKDGNVKIVLQGHTDYRGSDTYNEKLGLDRAEALKSELIALGVPPEKMATVSFGQSKPVYSEQEDWARAVNRRVEVAVEPVAAK